MKKLKEDLTAFRESLKITFQASGKYGVLRLLFSVLLSVLPFLSAVLWRGIFNGIAEKSTVVWWLLLGYVLFWGFMQLLRKADGYIEYKYNDRVNVYLETLFLDKYKDIDLSFYDSGELQNKIRYMQNIKNAVVGLSANMFWTLECFLRLIWAFVLLSQLNFWVAPAALALFVPVLFCRARINRLEVAYDKESAAVNRKSQYFKLLFRNKKNIRDIKIFGLTDLFVDRFMQSWKELYQMQKKKTILSTILLFIGVLFSVIGGQVLLYVLLILRLFAGVLQIGDVTYYISVFNSFLSSAENLSNSFSYIRYTLENTKVVREFLDLQPEISRAGTCVPKFEHEIEFSHVSFQYPGKETYVLRDCSFRLPKGKVVGLVGLNGAGKSTIVKLLLRLYDVTEGQILIDGVDIKDCDPVVYRHLFGVLFQDYVAYSLSLRENIALSDWEGRNDDAALLRAIEECRLTEKTSGFDKGLDTPLTRKFEPDGEELSGGQWQRLALGRVFFRDRPYYVLDEPSASLDVTAEHEIFHYFRQSRSQSGALIISHRLSTIASADHILFLADGKITEQGTHGQLLTQGGAYADLFLTQAEKYKV